MRSSSPQARHAIAVAALLCATALIAGCGSSGSPGATATTTVTQTAQPSAPAGSASPTPAGSSAQAGPPPCATSDLHPAIGQGDAAAGSSFYPIDLTNTGSVSCTLFGYPGVSFVTAIGGSQIGAAATRNPGAHSQLITVQPGTTVHATLQVVAAQNYPPSKCKITSTSWLRIYPPGQTAPLYVSFKAQACAGGPHATGVLSVQAVQPGAKS